MTMRRSGLVIITFFVVLGFVLSSCARGGGGAGRSPAARATATAEALLSQTPTPTPSPASESATTGIPTATPTSTPTSTPVAITEPTSTPIQIPTPTATPTSSAGTITVPRLVIAAIPSDIPVYDRADWKHWIDADRDCQNTRAEVLIVESVVSVGFRSGGLCTVDSGQWLAPYTGTVIEVAGDLDIDHMVPLANTHRSGGWAWTAQEKEDYANDLSFDGHLIAVTASANRSKGAKGPEEWQPPDVGYWCEYAANWITVKATWNLTATADEWTKLEDMLATCSVEVVFAAGEPPPTAEPFTPTETPTVSPSVVNSVSAGAVFVTEMMPNPSAVSDTAGEWFELYNSMADVSVDIDGWTIRDQGTNTHVINNGGPLLIPPQGFMVLGRNADPAVNGGATVRYQYSGFILANSGDEIELVDLNGVTIDSVIYMSSQVFDGASSTLNPSMFDAIANDQPTNWCPATSVMPGGDRGTPGLPNDACP